MLKDVGKASGGRKTKEEFQEGNRWKSFLKNRQGGVCALCIVCTYFILFISIFSGFPMEKVLNVLPQTITFIKIFMQNSPLLLNSIKYFFIIFQSLTIWIKTMYIVKCKGIFSSQTGSKGLRRTNWKRKTCCQRAQIWHTATWTWKCLGICMYKKKWKSLM